MTEYYDMYDECQKMRNKVQREKKNVKQQSNIW